VEGETSGGWNEWRMRRSPGSSQKGSLSAVREDAGVTRPEMGVSLGQLDGDKRRRGAKRGKPVSGTQEPESIPRSHNGTHERRGGHRGWKSR